MKKNYRKIIYGILALCAVFLIGTIAANLIVKNKVEDFIKNRLPQNMTRAYDEISVETFGGSLSITNASLIIKNKRNEAQHTFVNVEKLKISDVSYWDYLIHNEIHIENITLENPTIAYYQDRVQKSENSTDGGLISIYKPIIIDNLKINHTKLAIFEKGQDSTKLYTKGLSVEINGIKIDNNTIARKIPLDYKNYEAKSDTLFVKVSAFENLTVQDFSIQNRTANFKNLELKTKYSKQELSKLISKERDHYDLSVPSLSVEGIDFGFKQNRFYAKSKKVSLTEPSLELFRDKLVADETKTKPLYSKMLRELPFALTVDSLKISDAKIVYEERQNAENMGGSINFENLNAEMANVSNTYNSPTKTEIKIKSNFMEKTPITVNWSFDVQNTEDQFQFRAEVGQLVAERLNSFTEPNLKVMLEGNTNKTYFTIDGNNTSSTIDMKINYSDFKVTLLQKDGKEKNKFLSTIANIFISKNSEKKDEFYKEGKANATRNKSKSVFNFLWINVKEALIKILI
ncbi:MAG TPA: hypothetical protein PKH16_07560 [Aequorivita sp.]|jgi:hypothetical protein|nr:hypothetical protein [Aequorivita sp.]HNP67742.1 hypothetical protein [Aequorivita sp.]|tara:strand:- start:54713 stop:56260 length:1548 start_codon:yes stop_codon:yes gene_type:complete